MASLYSFPFTVLKSSAKAAEVKQRIKHVKTFVLISWEVASSLLIFWNYQVKDNLSVEYNASSQSPSLSEAQRLWSNSPKDEVIYRI